MGDETALTMHLLDPGISCAGRRSRMRIGFIAFMVWVMASFAGEVEVRMTAPTNTVYFD